ncbi:MAG: hypothetical protein HOY71_06635, partial [Nonomuraea sp.]|nr:hypothetical protein [Nonomuraea sp.]
RDVPAFALVAGVPARRIGWVGRAGVRLAKTYGDAESRGDAETRGATETPGGTWVCPRTGTKYRQTAADRLEEL